MPWLIRTDGGGRASAIGGIVGQMDQLPRGFGPGQLILLLAALLVVAGAMAARSLLGRTAAAVAFLLALLIAVVTTWYYRLYVFDGVTAGYGMYVGGGAAVAAALLSVWAMAVAWAEARRRAE